MKNTKYQRGLYTGAFDVINIGHIRGIQNAADNCEQLIVAVSTDEVIRDYKHHEPVMPFEQRLEIISQIKGVTLAIPQSDLYEKVEVCKALGVDVIFSCDEYLRTSYPEPNKMTEKEIAGVERWERFEEEANENGIDVVYLPRTQGTSSSMIKEKIISQSDLQQPQGIMLYSEGECSEEAVICL